MTLTHGGLFEGYGGTTMAARAALRDLGLGALETRWVSDIKPASVALLRHRHPEVPNLGDITALFPRDPARPAADVEPVDVLTASWPCQPHSSAGKRLGEEDHRALWPEVARAVAELRPAIFLGENVARITSNGELRRVVRSLADLGYVGAWRVLGAADVHGCHRRLRCFVAAVDPAADAWRAVGWAARQPQPGHGAGADGVGSAQPGRRDRGDGLTLLPTPTTRNARGVDQRGQRTDTGGGAGPDLQTAIALLPTPKATDGTHGGPGMRTSSGSPTLPGLAMVNDSRGGRNATANRSPGQEHHNSGWTLTDVVYAGRFEPALLPTPTAQNYGTNQGGAAGRTGVVRESLDTMARNERFDTWGQYAEAIARWGCAFDREAPPPTVVGRRTGKPQLSPHFVEWMMGLPQGWVCDVPDLARRADGHRNAALSLLGDGVMPQQGAAAFGFLLAHLAQRLSSGVAA